MASIKDKMRKIMSNRGYYDLTPEQRIKSNEESLNRLSKIQKNDYNLVRNLYKELRGGRS